MTLVLALVWGRGVLVTADSRASTGPVFHEERKVYPVFHGEGDEQLGLAVLAGSGDAALVKQGFELIDGLFKRWLEEAGEPRNPDAGELRGIVEEAESKLIAKYRRLREAGLDPSCDLLLASVTQEGEPRLYVFDSRGVAEPRHDNPGYAILGSGTVTGGQLLLRLLSPSLPSWWRGERVDIPGLEPGRVEWDLGMLSAFLIDLVSEVDPAVSPFLGESYFIRMEGGRVVLGTLTEEAYREYKERMAKRKALFKLLWHVAEEVGEDEVLQALTNLLERLRGR